MKYDYILFDSDNTLLDFTGSQDKSFKEMIARYGFEYSDDLYNRYKEINHGYWRRFEEGSIAKEKLVTERFEVFFSELGLNVDGKEVDTFYQDSLSHQSGLMPYAKEVCETLSERAKMSIVTNGVGSTANSRIGGSEIKQYIDKIVISEVVGYAKPDIEFFDAAFEIIGCSKNDKILIVGDSITSDIRGGINAGIDTCWYNFKNEVIPEGISINYVIDDLRQLLDIVD